MKQRLVASSVLPTPEQIVPCREALVVKEYEVPEKTAREDRRGTGAGRSLGDARRTGTAGSERARSRLRRLAKAYAHSAR
jgi:hypothetical protein